MSRHSKWSKVKQFKGAIDAKRSASFTKLAREITVAAREKGGDPAMNARLRTAIQKAREGSMPKENIERAIQRGTGDSDEGEIEALTYEAYAPGGTALIIECLTDNRNRTASEIKHVLSKGGGTLAASGAVTYLFDRAGCIHVNGALPADRHDEIELALIDAGATELIEGEDALEIRSEAHDFARLSDAVTKLGLNIENLELAWLAKDLIDTNEEHGVRAAELIEALEEHDDVGKVFSNLA